MNATTHANLDMIEQPIKQKVSQNVPSLLRPHQVDAQRDEISIIEKRLDNPLERKHVNVKDQVKLHGKLAHSLETQAPKAFSAEQLDDAIKLEKQLREDIIGPDMCTRQEMRKNPSGATDKHLKWIRRTGKLAQQWKNLRLRLGASGHDFGNGIDGDAHNLANLELYRPDGGAGELNMVNEQIEGLDFHGGNQTVVFSTEEMLAIKEEFPEVYAKMAFLEPEQRELIKQQIALSAEPTNDDKVDIKAAEDRTEVKDDFDWPKEGPYTSPSDQGWPSLCSNIFKATQKRPANKAEAIALMKEHNLK